MHADVPEDSPLYSPAPHAVHTTEVLAEATLPYAPAPQAVQSEVPVVRALYAPVTHAVQVADVLAVATSP